MDRARVGRRGERAAERWLRRRRRATVLARRWRGGGGELDLVTLEGETLVFVEVKTRSERFPKHVPSVSGRQRRRILRSAFAFRRRYRVEHLPFRFDLVRAIGAGRRPQLEWTPGPVQPGTPAGSGSRR